MSRRSRIHRRNLDLPGHAHELTFSCYHGFPLLKAERTCHWLAAAIEAACQDQAIDLWAYVVMPNHVHLIVHPRSRTYDMAGFRHAVKEPVGRQAMQYLREFSPGWLDRLSRQRGRRTERLFWQSGGGYDRNIDEPHTLAAMIEYIHLNPVRKKLAERAEDWRWSSAAYYSRGTSTPIRIDPLPEAWLSE